MAAMPALQIPQHSRRLSQLAVLGLSIVAVVGFAGGLSRQTPAEGPSPFPPPQAAGQRSTAGEIPEATPAPDMQVVASEPRHHRRPAEPSPDVSTEAVASVPDSGPAPVTADASDTVPDAAAPPAPPASPSSSEPPRDADDPPT